MSHTMKGRRGMLSIVRTILEGATLVNEDEEIVHY